MEKNLEKSHENNIKIYYFNFNGRVLIAKGILYFMKLPFTYITFTEEEWSKEKISGKFEFQQLPAVEINNKIYVQSTAIEIYLARKFNLMGDNIEDEYKIVSFLCSKNDLIDHLRPLVRPDIYITDSERTNLIVNILPKYFSQYEKTYKNSKGKYFISDTVTLADIVITILIYYIFLIDEKRSLLLKHIIDKYSPNLLGFVVRFYKKEMLHFFDLHYNFNYEF
jgi:glutathione S-transferase